MGRAPRKGEGYGNRNRKKEEGKELQRLWGGGLELRS